MHASSCSYAEVNRRWYTVYAKPLPEEYTIPLTLWTACSILLVHLKHTNKHIHTVSKVNAHTERKQNTWDDAKRVHGKMNMTCLEKQSNKRRLLPHTYIPKSFYYPGEGYMDTFCTNTAFAESLSVTTQECQLNIIESSKLLKLSMCHVLEAYSRDILH